MPHLQRGSTLSIIAGLLDANKTMWMPHLQRGSTLSIIAGLLDANKTMWERDTLGGRDTRLIA